MRAAAVAAAGVGVGYMEKYANPVYTYGQSSVLSSMSVAHFTVMTLYLVAGRGPEKKAEKKENTEYAHRL